jgi:hypothetical protein
LSADTFLHILTHTKNTLEKILCLATVISFSCLRARCEKLAFLPAISCQGRNKGLSDTVYKALSLEISPIKSNIQCAANYLCLEARTIIIN